MDKEQIEGLKLRCRLHAKPYYMLVGEVKEKDGTITNFLYCEKCYQSIRLTPQVEAELEGIYLTRLEAQRNAMDLSEAAKSLLQNNGNTGEGTGTAVSNDG